MLIFLLFACTPSSGTLISADQADTAVIEPQVERTLASEPSDWTVVLEIAWPAERDGGRPIDAHFSWLALSAHTSDESMWTLYEPPSPGMTDMAEWGGTQQLAMEMVNQGVNVWEWRQWTCPDGIVHDNCDDAAGTIQLGGGESVVSAATMVGPSPDWFVGVDSEPLVDGPYWRDEVVVDLFPLDAGTRDANEWELYGDRTEPVAGISRITAETGQRIGADRVGRLTLLRR